MLRKTYILNPQTQNAQEANEAKRSASEHRAMQRLTAAAVRVGPWTESAPRRVEVTHVQDHVQRHYDEHWFISDWHTWFDLIFVR